MKGENSRGNMAEFACWTTNSYLPDAVIHVDNLKYDPSVAFDYNQFKLDSPPEATLMINCVKERPRYDC